MHTAIVHPEILSKVVAFKMKFYPRAWAKYQDALNGGLKLIPPSNRSHVRAADCMSMKDMLFGRIPAFDEIMSGLQLLQEK